MGTAGPVVAAAAAAPVEELCAAELDTVPNPSVRVFFAVPVADTIVVGKAVAPDEDADADAATARAPFVADAPGISAIADDEAAITLAAVLDLKLEATGPCELSGAAPLSALKGVAGRAYGALTFPAYTPSAWRSVMGLAMGPPKEPGIFMGL